MRLEKQDVRVPISHVRIKIKPGESRSDSNIKPWNLDAHVELLNAPSFINIRPIFKGGNKVRGFMLRSHVHVYVFVCAKRNCDNDALIRLRITTHGAR